MEMELAGDEEVGKEGGHIIVQALTNPLLIPEIVVHIFGYLDTRELTACYDVCQIWRQFIPSYSVPARRNASIILVKGDMSDPDGASYLDSLREDPSSKASKFIFRDVDLHSPSVRMLLRENGFQMTELILRDSSTFERHSDRTNTPSAIMLDLLQKRVPFLDTLVIDELPPDTFDKIVPMHDANGSELALKSIDITLTRVPRRQNLIPDATFFTELFALAPHLEDVTIRTEAQQPPRISVGARQIIESLARTNRLTQIKELKLDNADDNTLNLLNPGTNENQMTVLQLRRSPNADVDIMNQILCRQSGSLEYVAVPINNSRHVSLPHMPNLKELTLTKPKPHPRTENYCHLHRRARSDQRPNAVPETLDGFLDYAVLFPNLYSLEIKGFLHQYMVSEIYPENANPCTTLQVLGDIPIGVDRQIMARIGRLFPNIKILCAVIPYEHEQMLVSIWECCPNITVLALTMCDDAGRRNNEEAQLRDSLDSIFSGISEPDCRRLRALPATEQKDEPINLDLGRIWRERPSIRHLKKLKCLHLRGPSPDPLDMYNLSGNRRDENKLSDIFGYSTLVALSDEFCSFKFDLGLIKISETCIDHICSQRGMYHVVGSKSGGLINR